MLGQVLSVPLWVQFLQISIMAQMTEMVAPYVVFDGENNELTVDTDGTIALETLQLLDETAIGLKYRYIFWPLSHI